MIADSKLFTLFPTLVWKLELESAATDAIDAQLRPWLDQAMESVPDLESGQSWQSDPAPGVLDALGELPAIIDRAVETVLRFQKVGHEGFEVTGCWVNVNAPGAGHRIHRHPNNFVSGVYYVQVQHGADTINFHDPRPQTGSIRPPVTEVTGENTDQVVVEVERGTLLLFPAWLEHSVDPNRSEDLRISVSFNVMFSPYTRAMSAPMWSGGLRGP